MGRDLSDIEPFYVGCWLGSAANAVALIACLVTGHARRRMDKGGNMSKTAGQNDQNSSAQDQAAEVSEAHARIQH